MKVFDYFQAFFQNTVSEKEETPDGYCPNCWGNQEYANQIRVMHKDKQIDVNNHQANHAFIQDFVVNHIKGIKLQDSVNGYVCPTCKTVYPK